MKSRTPATNNPKYKPLVTGVHLNNCDKPKFYNVSLVHIYKVMLNPSNAIHTQKIQKFTPHHDAIICTRSVITVFSFLSHFL